MKKFLAIMFCVLCTTVASSAYAADAQYKIDEFSTIENMESIDLDEAAQLKVNALVPNIARRFCNLKVRPVYVTVTIYLVQVQWSLDRLCGEATSVVIVSDDETK
jgi:hypothetical protein